MKVLAVRGHNLASLHGAFEVDFRGEALGRAGLFSITGPTGAGKSTLLDAICLALFDKTPRFDGRGGVEIGGAGEDPSLRIRTRDVRGILRRGAVRADAEVDFVGIDDKEYRARWEVWRAREKVDGKLQDQRMELIDLATMRRIGERKSDVLAEIERRLGLSFEQFRRSVLLAQGEFSAFLRADAAGRAELLERMTRTEIYRDLSRAAHERAKERKQALTLLSSQLEALGIADAEQRQELERRAKHERTELERVQRASTSARAFLDHLVRATQLGGELAAAVEAHGRAQKAHSEASPRREHLARVQRAHELRPWVERHGRERRVEGELRRKHQLAVERAEQAQLELERRAADLASLEARHVAACDAMRSARPELEQAREAQRAQREAARVHATVQASHTRQQAHRAEAVSARNEARKRGEALEVMAGQAKGVLQRLSPIQALSRSWSVLRDDLEQLVELSQHAEQRARALEAARVAHAEAREAVSTARDERDRAKNAVRKARSKLKAAQRARAALPPAEELRRRRLALDRALGQLRALHDIATAAARLDDAMGMDADRVRSFSRAAASASKKWDQARTDGARLEGRVEATRVAIRRLEATLDLVARRADLEDGTPCPLCGAEHHPAAHDAAPSRELDEARRELRSLVDQQRDIVAAEGALAAESASAGARGRECEERIREAKQQREELAQRFGVLVAELAPTEDDRTKSDRDQLNLLGLDTDTDDLSVPSLELSPDLDRGAVASTWSLVDACEQRLRRVVELESEAEQRGALVRTWGEALEQAQELEEAAREQLSVAREAALHAERDVEESSKQIDAAAHTSRRLIARLAPSFTERPDDADPVDWGQTTPAQLGALLTQTDAWVVEVVSAETALQETASEREQVARRLADLEARLAERTTAVERLEQELSRATQALEAARTHSAAFFDGRAPDEVEAGLSATVEQAAQQRETARRAHERGVQDLALAKQTRDSLASQCEEASVDVLEAAGELERAREARGLDPEMLPQLLSTPIAFVDSERAALERIDAELADALTVRSERERRLATHRQSVPPLPAGIQPDSQDLQQEATDLMARCEAELDEARDRAAEAAALLRQDDMARSQRDQLAPRLAEARVASEQADRLSEVIGSASGTKFQAFAQSLTLEVLLAHANAHLRDLKPRYQLARVPGEDLELQLVDRDLGHEVRSIHSLSGGESFLVSLALALGLSSLSAHNCRIDSLFIDEGFGTLDAQTLEVALDTLDALQGEGRQIGIISHVPGMAERIGVEVRVEPQSAGRSRVRVVSHGMLG